MYENGAFGPFNGVVPESLFHRRNEYATYVEGRICRLDKIRPCTAERIILMQYIFFFISLRRKMDLS